MPAYKKFPVDYALKHEILALRQTYHIHVEKVNAWLDLIEETQSMEKKERRAMRAAKAIVKFIYWLMEPRHAVLVLYKEGMKDRFLRAIEMWMGKGETATAGDVWLYSFLPGYRIDHIRASAEEAFEVVSKLQMVREISLKDF